MKKILTIILSCILIFSTCMIFSGCNALDMAEQLLIIEELSAELDAAQARIEELESENATLRFNAKYPTGLITESCELNRINIHREVISVDNSIYAIRADGENVKVTINGGYYNAGEGSLYNITVWAHNKSEIIINGGEFITGNDINGEANHVVYAAGGSKIEINGGTFRSTGLSTWLLNCQDNNGTIIVKGGIFINFDPTNCISEGINTNFVAEGYGVICTLKTTDSGVEYKEYRVVPESELPVETPEEPEDF